MPSWPSGSKAATSTSDNPADSISGARGDINQTISNVNDIIDIFNIEASPTDGHILVYDTDTGKFETGDLIEGTPGAFTSPLLHLKTKNAGFNRSQMKFSDSSGANFDLLGRFNSGNGFYQSAITYDPDGGDHPTGSFVGDKAYYFQWNSTGDEIRTDIFGAANGHIYSVFGDFRHSYGYKDMEIRANSVALKEGANSRLTVGSSVDIVTNTQIDINSGGTVTLDTPNTSATALGNRITVGDAGTAHTGGDGFLVRRGTGSGFEEQLKVETDSSATKVTVRGLQLTGATVDSTTSFTQSGRLTININGTNYYIPLDAV